jgi:hypothetical protein
METNLQHSLDQALSLASRGFWVFPLKPGAKEPAYSGWQDQATRDPEAINRWFAKHPYNVGIYTGKYGDSQALCVIDVDVKGDKRGDLSIIDLDFDGFDIPETLRHTTPTGGQHIIYACDEPLKQGVEVLGSGLDIRSRGGYIVAPGSVLDGKPYETQEGPQLPVPCPAWLVEKLGAEKAPRRRGTTALPGVVRETALARAKEWLLERAPLAVQNEGGDITTFKVAAVVKDYGCDQDDTLDLMLEFWNDRCSPPWDLDELATKVTNAFNHGENPQGAAAPEAAFEAVPQPPPPAAGQEPAPSHPVLALNAEYAYVAGAAGRVLRETTDSEGNPALQHMQVKAFHEFMANRKISLGDGKEADLSKLWMEHPDRRTFDGLVFSPGTDMGPRWYNLWRGFKVDPVEGPASHPALDMFLEHALQNVCGGNQEHFRWLMGWFAHLIQKPGEKPLVALVMKGRKGTGKNALIERVGYLLGPHALVADDQRYLTSQFNGHMAANLLLVLDEAVWSGDKSAEGRLKGLITGAKHNIEKKGLEIFSVNNLTRVVMLSNERWVCPASADERRFAVFEVGDGRRQDRQFFRSMREGMERGGYSHLLRYLLDFDLTGIDVNAAPDTDGLRDQKRESLRGPERFLAEIIELGEIQLKGNGFAQSIDWVDEEVGVPKGAIYTAFTEASRLRYREYSCVSESQFWKTFGKVLKCGGVTLREERPRGEAGSSRGRVKVFPPLSVAGKALANYLSGN